MAKRVTGRYANSSTSGERVEAFVPHPLPPAPPVDLSGRLAVLRDRAHLALGRLDMVSALVPDPQLFLYHYVRKEAVLSSRIEGTRSSLSDLMLFEMEEAPGVPIADVEEVSKYIAALEHGLARLREGFPLSNRLIREIHGVLMTSERGAGKTPGEFRRTQNWIGGSRPSNARFVPPPPEKVMECMGDLELFLHEPSEDSSPLIKAGLAHVQFETIHPFLDGNGRVGRLLITLILVESGIVSQPLLYPSLYFKQHRTRYYELLDAVRTHGDWENWMDFFFLALTETANDAVDRVQRIRALVEHDTARIHALGRPGLTAATVHRALQARPLATVRYLAGATGLSHPTVNSSLNRLRDLEIVAELTGRKKGRIFGYRAYMDLLQGDMEEPPG